MSLNWREIDLIISELDLGNALFQNAVQTDFMHLYLEFYKPGGHVWLLVVLEAGMTRLHRAKAPPKGVSATRFVEFLRARAKGARLVSIGQLGGERIVDIRLENEEGPLRLLLKLWSNAANVLAVNADGVILDACFRRPARNEAAGSVWQAPLASPVKKDYEVRAWNYPGDFNAFIEDFYAEAESGRNFQLEKDGCVRVCDAAIVRVQTRLDSLKKQESQSLDFERLKELGQLIIGNKGAISPSMEWVELDDWFRPGNLVKISLDPALSVQDNAEKYFQKYQKQRDGLAYFRAEIEQLGRKLQRLEEIEARIGTAANINEILEAKKALSEFAGPSRSESAKDENERPGLFATIRGFPVLIGRSAAENDELLRRYVKGNDYWLHVRDNSGGYVFIKTSRGKSVPLEVLLDAAHLAVHYSKARRQAEVDLFYTQVKYLRRAKHGTFGTVIPTREKNLHLRVDPARFVALQNVLNAEAE